MIMKSRRALAAITATTVGVVAGFAACTSATTRAAVPTPIASSPAHPPASAAPHRGATPSPSASTSGETPRGLTAAQRKVNRADASSTATAFAVRLEAWDTDLDAEPGGAAVRAATYATPKLRRRLLSNRQGLSAPGARWEQLVAHHGWVAVSTELGGLGPAPKDTATSAVRGVTTTPTDHGAGHWTSWPDRSERMTYVIYLTRTKPGADWSVSKYTIL
jgi:hypothetical protein